jgi:hypothetical protein
MIIVGNGESRKGISLPFECIGCNGIHRDFQIQHLICVDLKTLIEATLSKNTKNTTIYTRPEWIKMFNDHRVVEVPNLSKEVTIRPDEPRHWGSGSYAVLLGALTSNHIRMIGFDLYGKNDRINNIYKDTKNYSSSESYQPDPSYTIYQISNIFKEFDDKYFVLYNNDEWIMPDEWKLPNVSFKSIDLFEKSVII